MGAFKPCYWSFNVYINLEAAVIPFEFTNSSLGPAIVDDAKEEENAAKATSSRIAVTSAPQTAPLEQGDAKGEEGIVDKLQEKTEKEIVRTVKVIETERRFSNTFPLLDLDGSIVNEILALARDSQHGKAANISDHSALSRLGITYGVLRRLGYSEELVECCLRFIDGVDLEEAHEWLFMYCTDEELQSHTRSKALAPKPQTISALPTPTLSASARSGLLAQTLSSTRLTDEQQVKPVPECDADLFGPQEFLDDDPNILYAGLKLELDERTRTPCGDSEESPI
ncbi:hypothetical protein EDB87DRAFT_1767048 [Lactarius vividus]|nr:hypothetical protein EDB87DRAFT_1767048 [Lactarius vividus]